MGGPVGGIIGSVAGGFLSNRANRGSQRALDSATALNAEQLALQREAFEAQRARLEGAGGVYEQQDQLFDLTYPALAEQIQRQREIYESNVARRGDLYDQQDSEYESASWRRGQIYRREDELYGLGLDAYREDRADYRTDRENYLEDRERGIDAFAEDRARRDDIYDQQDELFTLGLSAFDADTARRDIVQRRQDELYGKQLGIADDYAAEARAINPNQWGIDTAAQIGASIGFAAADEGRRGFASQGARADARRRSAVEGAIGRGLGFRGGYREGQSAKLGALATGAGLYRQTSPGTIDPLSPAQYARPGSLDSLNPNAYLPTNRPGSPGTPGQYTNPGSVIGVPTGSLLDVSPGAINVPTGGFQALNPGGQGAVNSAINLANARQQHTQNKWDMAGRIAGGIGDIFENIRDIF